MRIVARAWCGAAALSLLVPAFASAQERGNPFTELFGRLPERQGAEVTMLDFRTTSGVQFADILQEGDPGAQNDVPEGFAGSVDALLGLRHSTSKVQAQAHGRITYQEYRSEPVWGAPAYEAGGNITLRATTRLSVDGGGRVARSPVFQLLDPSLFGGLSPSGDPYIAFISDNDHIEGNVGVTADYTKRSSLSFSANLSETHFPHSPDQNFSARGVRGQWRRRMTRDLAVHVAYARDEMRQQRLGDIRFLNEVFDIGVDYATALPLARRTTLSFVTETSALRDNTGNRHYRLNGTVELAHGFKRTWRSSFSLFRATEFLPGFTAPVFSDSARAGISGYLSKRFIWNANLTGSRSQIGFASGNYLSYSGDSRLTFAMTRHFGIFGQYVYYHYQIPPTVDSIVTRPQLSRQAYAIGISTWVPLVNKEKVNRDPR